MAWQPRAIVESGGIALPLAPRCGKRVGVRGRAGIFKALPQPYPAGGRGGRVASAELSCVAPAEYHARASALKPPKATAAAAIYGWLNRWRPDRPFSRPTRHAHPARVRAAQLRIGRGVAPRRHEDRASPARFVHVPAGRDEISVICRLVLISVRPLRDESL